ncbi:MAG: serine/threonine-protein kinase [Planctomycetota bacterium]
MVRPESSERLSLAEEREIDRLCLAYEERARTGELPDVEAFLPEDSRSLWPRLRWELELLRDELARRSGTASAAARPARVEAGMRVGAYELLGQLGEGGMGTVFEAVQDRTRRRVALKVMRGGLAPRAERRFEREARLLGSLHHAGIAQLYDAGVHDAGDGSAPVPYLVMELLVGRTLLAHVDERRLAIDERLELFRRVCAAVQHAHEHGIVHRDLKPANIVVVDGWDGDERIGAPKVLDFGVASAVGRPWLQTLETQTPRLVGTIAYMSPEQLDGVPSVDGRSDVYSLGVVLFQLLSGRLPHDVHGESVPAIVERIRREDPPRLGELAAHLSGDLEVVVGKALEKDPAHRYPTAAALAADVDRHLRHLPIEARPPSAAARAAKFARRHRALVAGTAVAGASLLIALAVVSLFALRQVELREEADDRRRIAEAVSEFLDDLLSRANLEDPDNARSTTIYEALVAAEAQIDEAFESDPLSRAAVRRTLGKGFLSQGEPARAAVQFERALETLRPELGPVHLDLARLTNELGQAREQLGRYEDAEALYRTSLDLHEQLHGGDHADVAAALNNLGALLERRSQYDESLAYIERSLAMRERLDGPRSKAVANSLNSLGTILETTGRLKEAEAAYRRALELRRELLPPDHPLTSNVMNNLANLLIRSGQLEESERLHRELLATREATLDPDHPKIAGSYGSLAAIAYRRSDFAQAAELWEAATNALERRLGADHADTLQSRINLAATLGKSGDLERESELLLATLQPYLEIHGERSRQTFWLREKIARNELARGDYDRAEEILDEVLLGYAEVLPEHYGRGLAMRLLGNAATVRGASAEAVAIHRDAVRLLVASVGDVDPFTLEAQHDLARALAADGATSEALELARSALDALAEVPGDQTTLRARLERLIGELAGSSEDGNA